MRRSAAPSVRNFKSPKLSITQKSPGENLTSINNEVDKPPGAVRSTSAVLRLLNIKTSEITPSCESRVVSEKVPTCDESKEIGTGEVTYNVVWGKKSTKKHKTWEGDGTLAVENKCVTLRDEENKVLGKLSNLNTELFVEGYIFTIGGREVQIIDLITS